jgi:hypothetical protein
MKLFSDDHRRRERWFRYTINPWASLLALVIAVILTAIYHPPFIGSLVTVAGGLLGGMGIAYGPLSGRRWLEVNGGAAAPFITFLVLKHYGLDLDGRFFSLLAWLMFGMTAPFWIWRKRGMETFCSPDPSKPAWQLN